MKSLIIKYISDKLSIPVERKLFHKFSTWVGIISVALGSLAILVSLSILGGFEKMLNENAVKFTSHINVSGFNRRVIPNYQDKILVIKANSPEIKSAYPVLQREGLISSKEFVEGIVIKGINSEFENQLKNNIIAGSFEFSNTEAKEIIIGKKLADKLNINLGDDVVIYSIKDYNKSNISYPEINKFKLKAIYETGMSQYDDIIVYLPYLAAANAFKLNPTDATSIEIILHNVKDIIKVQTRIENLIDYPYNLINNFYELHSSIFAWIEIQKEPIPLVLGLISIVAIFNIITILLITIVEKTKSIAILSTLGLDKFSILKIFVFQGLKIGIKGLLIGGTVSLVFSLLQMNFKLIRLQGSVYFLDSLPIEINPMHYIYIIIFTISITVLATITPAYIALKIKPAAAFRFK
jgi:lipoprotein-releasing system permease protein